MEWIHPWGVRRAFCDIVYLVGGVHVEFIRGQITNRVGSVIGAIGCVMGARPIILTWLVRYW